MTERKNTQNNRIITGTVVGNRMEKTVVVQSHRRVGHKMYPKFVNRRVKYKVHDEKNSLNVGDTVRIVETRPLSRDKRWRILEILEKAPMGTEKSDS